jgi:MSHA biogenesis protein MshJ
MTGKSISKSQPASAAMSKQLKQYAQRFDAWTMRERALIAGSIIVAIVFLWWSYHAAPTMANIKNLQSENQRVGGEIENTRLIVDSIRQRIVAGVHKEKESQLARLVEELSAVEEQLRVTTIELVDPEKMFQLMNELVYRDSKLTLLSLKRREVRAAIPSADPEQSDEGAGIYRHVLELRFSGKYLDILKYMQSMEALDWKLLWDEIEISAEEPPKVVGKLVMSTLSTRKEWVGI